MKQNAHKNAAEIYEILNNFDLAKNHYTQALKIKENDSWVWTKIGAIQYKHFKNLQIAKECFEAAINTKPTLQRRGASICPILMQLAEINFKLGDYSQCEAHVDSILARSSAPNVDYVSKLFAIKMKAFFYSLKGEIEQKLIFLADLEKLTGVKECSYFDLEIIKSFYEKADSSFSKTSIPVYDKENKEFVFIGSPEPELQEGSNWIELKAEQTSLQGLFAELVEKLAGALDGVKEIDLLRLNASSFKEACRKMIEQHGELQETINFNDDEKNLFTAEREKERAPLGDDAKKGGKPAKVNEASKVVNGTVIGQNSTKRALRKKMDFTEQQLSQIDLKTLDQYKDFTVREFSISLNKKIAAGQNVDREALMEHIFSHKELMKCKKLIQNKQLFKHAQSNSDFLGSQNHTQPIDINMQGTDAHEVPQSLKTLVQRDLLDFQKLVNAIDGRATMPAIRTILQFSFQYNSKFVSSLSGLHLYKLFANLMTTEGPFSSQWISKTKEPWEYYCGSGRNDMLSLVGGSASVLISSFELALFNRHVQKALKSNTLMEQRQVIFDFLQINQTFIHQRIEDESQREQHTQEKFVHIIAAHLRIRLIYAMMYCAFEIKNDMMLSVNLYSQLQSFAGFLKENSIPILLPWIEKDYLLDSSRMSEFGDFKIKQAKVFKDYDSGLLKLKMRELQMNEEATKVEKTNIVQKIEEKEFDKYANFYIDQFFLYLNASVTVTIQQSFSDNPNTQGNEGSSSSCSQLQNEEKVKEMWSQLTYSLCRASTPLIIKATQSLFCVFTAVSYLNKSFYEQFVLKKLDFEKILTALHSRLQGIFKEITKQMQEISDSVSVFQFRQNVTTGILNLFTLNRQGNIEQDATIAEAALQRLLITLLRSVTPEFLHYNIFLTQSSHNAFQNMVQNQTIGQTVSSPSIPSSASTNNLSIILGLGSTRTTGQLIHIYPQLFFYLEFLKSIVTADPQKDNSFNLRTVTRLLIHIDKLAHQNPDKREIFSRAYSTLVVQAFPAIITCLKMEITRSQIQPNSLQDGFNQITLTASNNLLQLVSQMFKFFFDMKLNLSHLENTESEAGLKGDSKADEDELNNDEDEYSDEDQEDSHFRRTAHLSSLLSQLKREKQSKPWIIATSAQTSQSKTPMLRFFLSNSQLDMSLISVIIEVLNYLSQGRLLNHGQLTLKDIKTISSFNEVVVEYLFANIGQLSEKFSQASGSQLVKFFKEAARSDPFSQYVLAAVKDPLTKKDNQIQKTKLVVDYVENLIGHTVLQFAPFQVPRFDQTFKITSSPQHQSMMVQSSVVPQSTTNICSFYFAVSKKGGALGNVSYQISKIHETLITLIGGSESTQANNSNQSAFQQYSDLTNSALRNISRLLKLSLLIHPFQINPNADQSSQNVCLSETVFNVSYLQSLIHFQQYVTACGTLLFATAKKDQKLKSPESDKRNRYLSSAINCIILALRSVVVRQRAQESIQNSNFVWKDLNFFELLKLVLEHLLAIVLMRIKLVKLKKQIREMGEDANASKDERKSKRKIQTLHTVAFLLARISDIVDVLAAPSNDPRVKTKNNAQIVVLDVIELLLGQLQDSIANDTLARKSLFTLEKAEQCLKRVSDIADQHYEHRKSQQRLNLKFEYSYIQAKYAKCLSPALQVSLYQHTFMGFRRSLEIAQANRSSNGVLEAYRKLLKGSLQLAVSLKYNKDSLQNSQIQEYQSIIQDVVKPILQDTELRKFIQKEIGQSGLKDGELIEDGGAEGNALELNHSAFEEAVLIYDTNSQRVRALIQEANAPSGDDLLTEDQSFRRDENNLGQIYKACDFVHNNLGTQSKQWIKAKYQLMCTKSLLQEVQDQDKHGNGSSRSRMPPRERLKLLAEMLQSLATNMLAYDEQWDGMVYDFSDTKNVVTSISHQELTGLTSFKIKYISFFLDLCSQALVYEPVKEVYRKKLGAFKLIDQSGASPSNVDQPMPHELSILFNLSKDKYIRVLCEAVETNLNKYRQARKTVLQTTERKDDNKWKSQSSQKAKETFEAMRKEYQVTKEHVPQILKEVFDLLVEVYQRKSFLVTRKLVSEKLRQLVVQAVLNCCAMCGPDNFTPQEMPVKGKSQVKFLDLAKLSDQEYQGEGLIICINWYLEWLEKQGNKKNQDFYRKLRIVLEEFKLKNASEKQASSKMNVE